jgi:hypothetical protein
VVSENRAAVAGARSSLATTSPKGIAHHGSVSNGTSSSREPRYRPEPAASKPISRKMSRLRLRRRAASSSPINPSRVRMPSRPSGCTGGVSPSEICNKAPGRSTPLSHAFIGSTRRGLASMKCGVLVASSRM